MSTESNKNNSDNKNSDNAVNSDKPLKGDPVKARLSKPSTGLTSSTQKMIKKLSKKNIRLKPNAFKLNINFKKLANRSLFSILVILPWVTVICYAMIIAHPRYVSSSEVVVKQVSEANMGTGSGISALLGMNNTSTEDARYLTNYILSNDMLIKLDKQLNFKRSYYVDGTDSFYELPKNPTKEELLAYFKERIHVDLDEQTYVLTVQTEGFKPRFALLLNQRILQESEAFINSISQTVASDQLQYAKNQLEDAQERLNNAKNKLLDYQNKSKVFNPESKAEVIHQLVAGLQAQLSTLRTEERQLISYLNDGAPQLVSVRSQIKAVEQQIAEENAKLTSPNTEKLNVQMVKFEAIKAEISFATELYKIALTSLEKTRLEAFRKRKSLIVISSPYEAEEARYPRKHYIIWTSLAFLLIFYGFVRLLIAVIKDHAS